MNRENILIEARSWIGTRFHHQGRVKRTASHRGGVDCIGLLVGVAQACGYTVEDETGYSRIPDGLRLKAALDHALVPVALDTIQQGDVLLFTLQQHPQHVGIVSQLEGGELGLIHAYIESRGVVEHRLDPFWWNRAVAAYAFPGV